MSGQSDDAAIGSFGSELRRLRNEHHMTLDDLALAAHFSKGYLSKVENGRLQPTEALARACDSALETGGSLALLLQPRRKRTTRWVLARPIDFPDPARHFVGREAEIDQVLRVLANAAPPTSNIVVLHGMPGVGKTELALQVADRLRHAYPDGCLLVDLHPPHESLSTADATDQILRRLGIPGEVIPPEPEVRIAFYRDTLRDRKLLLLLDNAVSAKQVTALMPPGGRAAIIVASRYRLDALDEAIHIALDVLDPDAARDLFNLIMGAYTTHPGSPNSDAVGRLIKLCARLPLAIRIAAARLRGAPTLTVADLIEQLASAQQRVAALDDGERSVARTFAAACAGLPDAQYQLFAMLSLHPGASFSSREVGMLAELSAVQASSTLRSLVGASLLQQLSEDRFAFHDLIREIAAGQAEVSPDGPRLAAITARLISGYLVVAQHADIAVTPRRHREPQVKPTASPWYAKFADAGLASDWFVTEARTLVRITELAASSGADAACWQLAYALRDYFFRTRSTDAWIHTHQLALVCARRTGSRWAEAVTLNNLGLAYALIGDLDTADDLYAEAMVAFSELNDPYGVANTVGHQAWIAHERQDFVTAVSKGLEALRFYNDRGLNRNAAITLRTIALAEAELGQTRIAADRLATARDFFAEANLPLDEAMALNCLGTVALADHDVAHALRYFRQALSRARSVGATVEHAKALRGLASIAHVDGRLGFAGQLERRAASLIDGQPAWRPPRPRNGPSQRRIDTGLPASRSGDMNFDEIHGDQQ